MISSSSLMEIAVISTIELIESIKNLWVRRKQRILDPLMLEKRIKGKEESPFLEE